MLFGIALPDIGTAASTSRIRLGISSPVVPQRSPMEVARQLATLDLLSNERIQAAVGVG
jgi:alkanesulfonate monooxygenase SsuD/methylene tetrahydromethanopterin reductase-like flavin-dependent oxidoreductase (luciferase family)